MPTPSPELSYSALSAALTGSLWMPIIVNRLREMGLLTALKNPQPDVRPRAGWAYRLGCAHRNAIENLVVFAPLALTVHMLGLGTAATATAAALYFWSRLVHALTYTFDVAFVRTLAFAFGFGAQATMLIAILGAR
jgi:uncharacterized MAPEG superfamily protein